MFRRHGPPGGHGPMGSLANSRPNASATNANRKESGVKMLDITDQPLGYAAQKKRRKQVKELHHPFVIDASKLLIWWSYN